MASESANSHDEGWFTRLVSGDHRAFAEFVDKYKDAVFLCCKRLGLTDTETEDVASEVFLAVYKGISRFQGQSALGTWVWRIAYNKGISYLRKHRKGKQLLEKADYQIAGTKNYDPEQVLEAEESLKIIWDAVEKLPRLWGLAVILYYREEKSIADIAEIMKLRQNTVKTYLFRSRQKLKQIVAPVLGES